jgi:hypothetical protein
VAIRFLALLPSIKDDPNRSLDKETTIGTPHREMTGFPRTCAGFRVLSQFSGWLFSELLQGRLYPLVWWRVALQRLLYPFWYCDVYPSLQISKLWVREPHFSNRRQPSFINSSQLQFSSSEYLLIQAARTIHSTRIASEGIQSQIWGYCSELLRMRR